jgi:DNA-binding NarL/FixJ family response regulator
MTSVLIIDDHPVVLQGLRRVLEDAGVKPVLEAREVTSGYRLFRRNRPDVIIVDLGMQGSVLGGPGPHSAHAIARAVHLHPCLQHAWRPDDRRARS